jgi:hypothetical protein
LFTFADTRSSHSIISGRAKQNFYQFVPAGTRFGAAMLVSAHGDVTPLEPHKILFDPQQLRWQIQNSIFNSKHRNVLNLQNVSRLLRKLIHTVRNLE